MARDIRDVLHRFATPFGTGYQTAHHVLDTCGIAGSEAAFVVKGRADKGVADVIAESAYTRHLVCPLLHGELFVRISGTHRSPAFTIGEDGRIDLVESGTNGVHRLLVVDAHQVKTESVDVIFAGPVAD